MGATGRRADRAGDAISETKLIRWIRQLTRRRSTFCQQPVVPASEHLFVPKLHSVPSRILHKAKTAAQMARESSYPGRPDSVWMTS